MKSVNLNSLFMRLQTCCALCQVPRMHPRLPVPAQALLLAGLRLEEVAVTREIMDALGASEVKVLLLCSKGTASCFQSGSVPTQGIKRLHVLLPVLD